MHTTLLSHNSLTAQRPDLGRIATTTTTTTTEPVTDGTPVDEVDLSPEAQDILSGKSATSPAFLALQALAGGEGGEGAEGGETTTDYEGLPFGQIVKQFTPGHLRKAAEGDGTTTDPVEGVEAGDGAVVVPDDGTGETVDPVATTEELVVAPAPATTDTDSALLEGLADTETDA